MIHLSTRLAWHDTGDPGQSERSARGRRYEERMGIPVVGDGADGAEVEPGVWPLVITFRDGDDGSIDQQQIETLVRK
jgi:hypothetical protein